MQNIDEKLIVVLNNQLDFITSKNLAELLNVSVRTVKYCIARINKEFPQLIQSTSTGYRIDKNRAHSILSKLPSATTKPINDYKQRKHYIINSILMEGKKLTLSDLSDTFYISTDTLLKEISRLKKELSQYHLNVRTKNNVLIIAGTAEDKRHLIMLLVSDEIKSNFFSLSKIQPVFQNVDLHVIRGIVRKVLNNNSYFMDSYSQLNYVLHLGITIELRSSNSQTNTNDTPLKLQETQINSIGGAHIQRIVSEIYVDLKKIYNFNYNLNDIFQASALMMTRAVPNKNETIKLSQLSNIIDSSIIDLLYSIVSSVKETYGIDLNQENFLVRFAFHLKNLIFRLQSNIPIFNLQFSSIKSDYPQIYAIAVHISNVIYQETGLILPEDEIAYITLHIGVLIQEQNDIRDKVSALIISSDYNNIGKNIVEYLRKNVSDILIANVYTSIDDATELGQVDLLITTDDIDPSISTPSVKIDPFISVSSKKKIEKTIEHIKEEKSAAIIRSKIMYFFHEDLFFVNTKFNTSIDAIETMCNRMIEKHYVAKDFKELIYEHEKIAPSSYGRIAIAHPLNNKAKSSAIAISINPESIQWGNNQVNIVFMFSLKEEDRELFTDIFQLITRIVSDSQSFERIMKISNYQEFISLLTSLY